LQALLGCCQRWVSGQREGADAMLSVIGPDGLAEEATTLCGAMLCLRGKLPAQAVEAQALLSVCLQVMLAASEQP
jgi:hypothetical protein